MGAPENLYRRAERRIETLTLALGAMGAIFAAFAWSGRDAVGVAVGAGLGWLNFRWLKLAVDRLAGLTQAQSGAESVSVPSSVYARIFGRYILLAVGLYVIFSRSLLPGSSLLLGLFALVAAVLVEMILELIVWSREVKEN